MNVEQDGRFEPACTGHGRVEVVDLEPEKHAIADGARCIGHGSVVVIDLPCVQLQDQTVRAPLAGVEVRIPEPFVLGPSMAADAPEKALVPAAGGLNVAARDERLGAHERSLATRSRVRTGQVRRSCVRCPRRPALRLRGSLPAEWRATQESNLRPTAPEAIGEYTQGGSTPNDSSESKTLEVMGATPKNVERFTVTHGELDRGSATHWNDGRLAEGQGHVFGGMIFEPIPGVPDHVAALAEAMRAGFELRSAFEAAAACTINGSQ